MNGAGVDSDLVEFAFVSEVAEGLPPSVFARLARQSWSHNTRTGLTGELQLRDRRFTAVIEGPCAIVQPLAARILADRRHGLIRITAFRPVHARWHRGWVLRGFDFEPDFSAVDRSTLNLAVLPMAKSQRSLSVPAMTAGGTV